MTEKELWQEYKKSRTIEIRNQLVELYIPWAKRCVRFYTIKNPMVDAEELYGPAYIGLIKAVEKFDFNRGLKFATYSLFRIRGAIQDYIRSEMWEPRVESVRRGHYAQAEIHLQCQGKLYNHDEVLIELKQRGQIPPESIYRSFKQPKKLLRHGRSEMDTLTSEALTYDPVEPDYSILKGLNQVEQRIMISYYWEGKTMKEIGESLGISQSRVSQIRSYVIERLRCKHVGTVSPVPSQKSCKSQLKKSRNSLDMMAAK